MCYFVEQNMFELYSKSGGKFSFPMEYLQFVHYWTIFEKKFVWDGSYAQNKKSYVGFLYHAENEENN